MVVLVPSSAIWYCQSLTEQDPVRINSDFDSANTRGEAWAQTDSALADDSNDSAEESTGCDLTKLDTEEGEVHDEEEGVASEKQGEEEEEEDKVEEAGN
jgi:hypothetical protein